MPRSTLSPSDNPTLRRDPSADAMRRWCARHANLALVDVDEIQEPAEMLRILCECGERTCTEWLGIRAEDFAEIRAEPDQYAVAQAHAGGLRVVRQTVDYAVVLLR